MAVAVPGQGPKAERDPSFSGHGVGATSLENMHCPQKEVVDVKIVPIWRYSSGLQAAFTCGPA